MNFLNEIQILVLLLEFDFLYSVVGNPNEHLSAGSRKVKREGDIRNYLEHVTNTMDMLALSISAVQAKAEKDEARLDSVLNNGKTMSRLLETLSKSVIVIEANFMELIAKLEQGMMQKFSFLENKILLTAESEEKQVQRQSKLEQALDTLNSAIDDIREQNTLCDLELEKIRSEMEANILRISIEFKEGFRDLAGSFTRLELAQSNIKEDLNAKLGRTFDDFREQTEEKHVLALQKFEVMGRSFTKLEQAMNQQENLHDTQVASVLNAVKNLEAKLQNETSVISLSLEEVNERMLDFQELTENQLSATNATLRSMAATSKLTLVHVADLQLSNNFSKKFEENFRSKLSFSGIPTYMLPKLISNGTRVMAYTNSNETSPGVGIVIDDEAECDGRAHVKWANGTIGNYSVGEYGKYDLYPAFDTPVEFALKLLLYENGEYHKSRVKIEEEEDERDSEMDVPSRYEEIDFTNCLKTDRCCKNLCDMNILHYTEYIYPIDGCITVFVDKNCKGVSRDYKADQEYYNLGDLSRRVRSVKPCSL